MNMWRSVTKALLLFCFLPFPLLGEPAGLDPSREIGQYSHRAWTKRDGLPQNSVTSIAQTPDGYLWFGTMEGLARFDGTSFFTLNTRNTPQLGMNYVLALFADQDSTLWIGTNGGGVLRIRNGEITKLNVPCEQEHLVVREFNKDRHGNIWVATTAGLAQFKGDSLIHLFTVADGLPANLVYSSAQDQRGRILALTPKGVWIREGDCFEPYIVRTTWGSGVKMGKPIGPTTSAGKRELNAAPTKLLCDRRGALWIGTAENGLFVLTGDSMHNIGPKEGLGSGAVSALFEDQRGTLWVGTTAGGISRVVNSRVTHFASSDGLSGDEVLSIEEDREGVLWVGVSTGGVNRFINSKFTTFRTGVSAVENMVWGLFADPSGRLMASTAAGTLVEYRNGVFVPSAIIPGKKPREGTIFAFAQDHRSNRWAGYADWCHALLRTWCSVLLCGQYNVLEGGSLRTDLGRFFRGALVFHRGSSLSRSNLCRQAACQIA